MGEIDKIHQIPAPIPSLPAAQRVGDGANRRPAQERREQHDELDLHQTEQDDDAVAPVNNGQADTGLDLAV